MPEKSLYEQKFRKTLTNLKEILQVENTALKELDFNKVADLAKNKLQYVRAFTDQLKKLETYETKQTTEGLADITVFFTENNIPSADLQELIDLISENRELLKKSIDLQSDLMKNILRVASKKVPLYNQSGNFSPEKPQPRFGCGV